jgi:hypothetical protein
MNTPPPEGWGTDWVGNPTFTVHGPSFDVRPPELEGHRCHWIARHGPAYTTWTYRPIETED